MPDQWSQHMLHEHTQQQPAECIVDKCPSIQSNLKHDSSHATCYQSSRVQLVQWNYCVQSNSVNKGILMSLLLPSPKISKLKNTELLDEHMVIPAVSMIMIWISVACLLQKTIQARPLNSQFLRTDDQLLQCG